LVAAENDIQRARLAASTNDLIAKVAAEKNTLTLEQSIARLAQLKETYDLRRVAAAADLRILQIRRERAERAMHYAEGNATLMQIRAPFPGLVVVKTTWRPGREGQVEIMEGDEVRPGLPVIDIVDTSAMQVRARVNQADVEVVRPGSPATVRLDGFPELSFKGKVEVVTPLAITGISQTVRTFVAIVSIEGTHPQLLPDLTASVEVTPAPGAGSSAKGGQ
jgi:multidrug resistance efflux pump